MASDYKKIAEEHRVGYGSFTDYRSFFYEQLYKKKTHFTYELIQNAVDSKSSQLELRLKENELFVWNDGDQFSEKDVRSICSLGSSSKDLTQIGTFGIGFKSVYNYTDCPEIYSGDEHFCIRDLTQPEGINNVIPQIVEQVNQDRTVFRLPFKDDLSQEDIVLLKEQFCKLGERYVLLFLRDLQRDCKKHFKTIRWIDERDGQTGICSCIHHPHSKIQDASEVELTMSLNSENQLSEMFLVFHKVIQPPQNVIDALLKQTKHDEKRQPIEIAFKLHDGSITAMDDNSVLFAYLPTQKETHLKFLIQARYQTTSGRADIQEPSENPWNRWLVQETANFLPEVLEHLKAHGLLEPAFFNILPLKGEVENEFKPIAEALQKAMQKKPLVPTENGGYAKAETVFYPHHESLLQLIESSWLYPGSSWLHTDIGRSGRAFDVMKEAGVKEINVSHVLNWLEKQELNWFETRCEKWLRFLYTYLKEQGSQLDRIKKLPLIRLENGRHVCASELVFFPPDTDEARKEIRPFLDELPIVQLALLDGDESNNIENFLKDLKVRALCPEEMIGKWIIPQYAQFNKPSVEVAQNYQHVRYLFKVWDKLSGYQHQNLRKKISEAPILRAYKGIRPEVSDFVKPCDAYLSEVYTGNADLETYFSVCDGEIWFVDDTYLEEKSDAKAWLQFLKAIGSMDTPCIIEKTIFRKSEGDQEFDKELDNRNIKGESKRSTRGNPYIEDFYLQGLSEILDEISEHKKIDLSQVCWDLLVKALPSGQKTPDAFFQGTYHRFYYTDDPVTFEATFYRQLKETTWLPDEKGKLHRPSDCFAPTDDNRKVLGGSVPYLHPDFDVSQDNETARWLAEKLGIHLNANTDSVINYLQTLSGTETSVEKVLPLYCFLEDQGARRSEEFKQKPLIFTSNPEPNWWKCDKVFWEDESAVFGNRRGYLKENYADYEATLKPFFIALGVSERASPSHYVRVIREVASVEEADNEGVRKRVKILYRRLWQSLQEGGSWQEDEEWQREWKRTRESRCWLGNKGSKWNFFSRNELVWNDHHDYIAEIFKGEVPFWTFDNDLLGLAKNLEIEGGSHAEVKFHPKGDQEEYEVWSVKVQELHPYIHDFLNSPRLCEVHEEGKSAYALDLLSVRLVEELKTTYTLKGISLTHPNPRQSFLDVTDQGATLWLALEADKNQYAWLIGDALQYDFGDVKELSGFVEDLLTKNKESVLTRWKQKGLQTNICVPSPEDSKENKADPAVPVDEILPGGTTGSEDNSGTDDSEVETPAVHENPETGNENDDSMDNEPETYTYQSRPSGGRTRQRGDNRSNTPNRSRGIGYNTGGGGPPSEEHENLKDYLADNPSELGNGLKLVKKEYTFKLGGRVDILLQDSSGNPVTVEVKPYNIPPGSNDEIWQAVRYKHVAAAEYDLQCDQVRSILAAPEIPDDVKAKCKQLGIEVFEKTQR